MEAKLKSKILRQTISEDGELMEEKSKKWVVEDEKEFLIMYCKVVGLFKDMRASEMQVMAWIISNCQFNKNIIVLVKSVKEKIAEEMNLTVGTIENSIPELVRKGFIYKDGDSRDGVYGINPEYFWKGELGKRNKALKYVLEMKLIPKTDNNDV